MAEALAVFGLIMAYIWRFRVTHPFLWAPILAVILISQAARRESPAWMGFRARDFGTLARQFTPALVILALLLLAAGLWFHTIRPITPLGASFALAAYLPWGLFQQYLLNAYFLNRFESALHPRAAAILTGVLFAAAHAPNWFLMATTLLGGLACTHVYQWRRNLYFLGLAHGIFGFLLFLVFPDSISHHLRVGPGWYSQVQSFHQHLHRPDRRQRHIG